MEATCSHLLSLLFFSSFLLLSPRPAFAVDTLGKGSNITGTETLVSADGTFTMGFFSPGGSSKRYYLGIWFTVSSDAVCWVANRDHPIDKGGALVVSDTGSLLLLDGSSQVKWSSNSTSASPVDAQLLNKGNLVVRNPGSNTVLWQSFDHPSNAMLSGMKVGTDFWDGAEWHLTSWRSADDPSPGAFRRVLDTSGGMPDNVVWQGNVKTFRTGPWNGLWFSGIPEVFTYKNLIEYQMVITPREKTYGYVVKPGAPPTYVLLTETGAVKRQVWDASSRAWHTYYKGPRDVCDDYGKCGAFGICNVSAASTSFCSCLKGFIPVSPSEWKGKEVSGGCRRNVTLDCGGGATTDGFELLLPGVKLPDTHNASVDMSITVEQCRARCLANCSCVAYAAADIRGGGAGSGCVIWAEDLIDLRYVDGGQDLYLRLPKSGLGPAGQMQEHGRNKLAAIIVPPVVAVASLLTLVFLIWTGRVKLRHIICCYVALDLATIRRATGNFLVENVIGDGAFGIVYQGKLPRLSRLVLGYPGRTIAVKRLRPIPGLPNRIAEYFTREVELMATVGQHPNVLQFLAYCEEDGEKILVYEYMPRRSLDIYIFGDRGMRALLDWNMRLKIIQQTAKGVYHLSSGNIIHRDLKPANVLLDDGWNAKVADFGTARLYVARATGTRRSSATPGETSALGETSTRTRTIIGTPAYMAPEYAREGGQTTSKCDVYSFGVTLLETLGGRKNSERPSFVSTVRREWAKSKDDRDIMTLLDSAVEPPPTAEPELAEKLSKCIQIGLLCVQENPDDRPNMSEVVTMLSTRATLPEPVIPEPLTLPEEEEYNSNMASLQEARLSRPTVYETVDLT